MGIPDVDLKYYLAKSIKKGGICPATREGLGEAGFAAVKNQGIPDDLITDPCKYAQQFLLYRRNKKGIRKNPN